MVKAQLITPLPSPGSTSIRLGPPMARMPSAPVPTISPPVAPPAHHQVSRLTRVRSRGLNAGVNGGVTSAPKACCAAYAGVGPPGSVAQYHSS